MNFKEALRRDTNYLRGLGSLDSALRQKWINSNIARLQQAKKMLTKDDYKTFAENLYNIQLWNSLEADNINKGVYGKGFKPTIEQVNNYFNKKVSDIDTTLKYHPDLDENNVYVGSKKNTGLSPELWNVYSSLKDEDSKREFLRNVKTEDQVWKDSAKKDSEDKLYKKAIDSNRGDKTAAAMSFLFQSKEANLNSNHPLSPEYLDKHRNNISTEAYNFINKDNTERAQAIYSNSLKKWRESPEYQQSFKQESDALQAEWDDLNKKYGGGRGDKQLDYNYLESIKDNNILSAASGYDKNTGKFAWKQFQQYESLLEDSPSFKKDYLTHEKVLKKQLQEGKITEDDYRQSLLDIASNALKDHESFWRRAANAGRAAVNTGLTYTLHKFAPLVNAGELLSKGTDGKIFLDVNGNVYKDSEITSNAQFNKKSADDATLYKTEDGNVINYNKDKNKIFTVQGQSYIYQSDGGEYLPMSSEEIASLSGEINNPHIKRVDAVKVKNTPISNHDLSRLGKDDSGNDLNWAGGLFNERYLQLSDKYNKPVWNQEALNHYEQTGYSPWVNVQRPGDTDRDFLGETLKMMGFVGADLLSTFALNGAGKALGASARAGNVLSLVGGLGGAVGIADSYAQGVFEENLINNEQTLRNVVSEEAKSSAQKWATSKEGQAEINKTYADLVATQEQQEGRTLSESEKAQIQAAVYNNIVGKKAQEIYTLNIQSPKNLALQEKALEAAGKSAIVDFMGEGLKYGIVNTLMFRKWMFKGNAAEEAARASEQTLFGKTFSKVGKATAEDVEKGLAEKEGDYFLKKAWSSMSKKQKAWEMFLTTGRQAWGGAWTNWSDEMQSAGAKKQNDTEFTTYLNGESPSGAYLFANALSSQLQGIGDSVFEPNSVWAGLIGGAGSVLGFGFNPLGAVESLTNRNQWEAMSSAEKFNSVFSNSVLSAIFQQKANDRQASYILDRLNRLQDSIGGENALKIIDALEATTKIGKSELAAENEESDVKSLIYNLRALKAFGESNPGLMELDYSSNLRKYQEEAGKLADISKLNNEEKQSYVEEIKIQNPTMDNAQAEQHLNSLSKKAQLALSAIEKWENLQDSKSYQQAGKTAQDNMEKKLALEVLQEYTLQNMREREEKIKGSSTISSIDAEKISVQENGTTVEREVTYGEDETVATYGSRKGLLIASNANRRIGEQLQTAKNNAVQARESLHYDEKIEALQQELSKEVSPIKKEEIKNKIAELTQDKSYYDTKIEVLEAQILENQRFQESINWHLENKASSNRVYSATEILFLDPIARMRMLLSENLGNYSKIQQKQIKKVKSLLAERGVTEKDITDQAYAVSRYSQVKSTLSLIREGGTADLCLRTRVTNMIRGAKEIVNNNVVSQAKTLLKQCEEGHDQEIANQLKKDILKKFSVSHLRHMRELLKKRDKQLVDEILPIAETASQLYELIHDEQYGLSGLNAAEKNNIQSAVAEILMQSTDRTDFIEKLAESAQTTPSINTLLDKLAKVYEQQCSTIIETARERAYRKEQEKAESKAREEAAKTVLEPIEKAPAATPSSPPEPTSSGESSTETFTVGQEEEIKEADKSPATEKTMSIEDAKKTILNTQAKVQPVGERDPHADFYILDGEQYMRVHGAMGDVWVGANSPNKEANSARSLMNGTIVDGIVRGFFNDTPITKPDNFSQEAFDSLKTSLETIKAKLKENGEEFLTSNIVLYHKFPNGVKIAGEADIVSVKIADGKPQYSIYDLKTSAGGRDGKAFTESPFWETNSNPGSRNTVIGTKEQYTNQVSLYKLLFEKMLNTPITSLALLPYKLIYDAENNVTGVEKLPDISLEYNKNIEKLVAYQPAIEEALVRIQKTYKGIFTKEQLATLKGIISNGIIKGESFGKDTAYFIINQGLEDKVKEIGMHEMSPIIKDLKEAVSNIDVVKALKEEYKVPESSPTPPSPAELATTTLNVNAYSPDKVSLIEPDVDAEFNKIGDDSGSTELPQTNEVTEEVTDMNVTTNELNNEDINKEEGEIAATIKGNAMSPWVFEDTTTGVEDADKQDVQRGILVQKNFGPSMQNFYVWMNARKIHLQELIDEKLSDILSTGTEENPVKIYFMRVNPNMTAVGNDKMKSHYLLVVEDSPALRKVYTQKDAEKYGDFVKANGKQYLIVGTAGFANSAQGNAYRKILTKGQDSVLSKSNDYFRSNTEEEFYVDPDKYTHVARMHSGFITKQLATDSAPQVRRLSELLNDKERNPLGVTWDDLVFGYQMRNGFRTVPAADETKYFSPVRAPRNLGNVFLYIKGADGTYTPTMLLPTRYSEIDKSSSLNRKIETALRMLTSLDHKERYNGLRALYDLIVLGQQDYRGLNTGTDILIGTFKIPTLTFILDGKVLYTTNLKNTSFQDLLTAFERLNPRISVTKLKLLNTESLKELDSAGALRTDIAKLGKSSGDYSVYNIGTNGKPIIKELRISSNSDNIVKGGVRQIRIGEQYYHKLGENFIDEKGNIVEDVRLKHNLFLNELILKGSYTGDSIRIGFNEYFLYNSGFIKRDLSSHEATVMTDVEEIATVREALNKEREQDAAYIRDNTAAEALEETTTDSDAPTETPSKEDKVQKPIDPISSVTDFLNMDNAEKQEEESKSSNTPATSGESNATQDINVVERKSLNASGNVGKNATFVERNALEILASEDFADMAIDEITRLWPTTEDMTMNQIVEFLEEEGKVVSGIKDVKSWIDTLKC